MKIKILVFNLLEVRIFNVKLELFSQFLFVGFALLHQVHAQTFPVAIIYPLEVLLERGIRHFQIASHLDWGCYAALRPEDRAAAANHHERATVSVVLYYLFSLYEIRCISLVVNAARVVAGS